MKCSNCHNEIPKESKICPICGTIFASYFEDIILTKKQKRKLFLHKMLFPIIFLTIILAISTTQIIKQKEKTKRITDLTKIENPVNYVNDLYASDERNYKYILNKKEKEIYDIIFNAIKNYDETISIDLSKFDIEPKTFTTETLRNIKHVLSMDHPELINLGSINVYSKENTTVNLIINYAVSKKEYEESINKIKEKLEEIKQNTLDLTEYEKVKYIYEYFDENTSYAEEKDTKYYSAYGCFIMNKCNINGYAKALQITFINTKINSILATGTLNNKYHEWNIVSIENKYYNYDQTQKNYKGFLFKNKQYKPYHKNMIPSINGKKYLTK